MKRPRVITVVRIVGAVFLLYLLSEIGALRWIRDQMRESVVGPTPEQVRAAAEAPPPAPVLPPRNPVVRKVWLSDPPSRLTMVIAMASILVVVFGIMFFTGRSRGDAHHLARGSRG